MDLYLAYRETTVLRRLLRAWDAGTAGEATLAAHRWTDLALWPAARSATVAGSTGIEGNPLDARQVDQLLAGGTADATAAQVREVFNYNDALNLANRAALREDFGWSQELLRRINATVMRGLADDEGGEYRQEPVTVGEYHPPEHRRLPALMAELVDWLGVSRPPHPLMQAGLVHLNLVSIHPWLNGNGRTSRVAASLALMRRGVGEPELVNIESWLRAHQDEYIAALRAAQGSTYDPDNQSATPWLEFYAQVSVDRLEMGERLEAALPGDIGRLALALSDRDEPIEWTPILISARLAPLRTTVIARRLEISGARARAILAAMSRAGWLRPVGERRGRRYEAAERLLAMDLRMPALMDRLRAGDPVE